MKLNKITIAISLVILLLPVLMFASGTDSGANQALQFLKGDGAIEKWFLNSFSKMAIKIETQAEEVSFIGRAIGSIGALMYLGYLGWEMQEGARPWEITPMLRPIILGFILTSWVPFTKLISVPLEQLATPSRIMFNEIEKQANDLRIKRYTLQKKLVNKAIKMEAEQAIDEAKANGEKEDGIIDKLSNKAAEVWRNLEITIKEWALKTQAGFQRVLAEVIEAVALTILRVCVYGLFAIQKLWSFVLIALGPIAVGMALIPGFEGSFYNWVSKFININLYTFIAFTGMTIGHILIISGYEMEIDRYELILKGNDEEIKQAVGFFAEGSGFINVIIITVVTYIITGILVLMTPTIADSIVSAGGAGIASKMKQATSNVLSGGKKGLSATGGVAKAVGGTLVNTGRHAADKLKNLKQGATPKF